MNLFNQPTFITKFRAGGLYTPVECIVKDRKIELYFPYNADLLLEVKTRFENRKWLGFDDGPKGWSIPITQRNIFQFRYLQGKYADVDPYKKFEKHTDYTDQIIEYCKERQIKSYKHQVQMINHILNVGWFITAGEMGVGKSLAAIIALEMAKIQDIIWVGPRAPLIAVKSEFQKWRSVLRPKFCTYEELKKIVESWPVGKKAPQALILDEISRCKNPAAQRTIAAKHIADSIRDDWGTECIIGGLSGTPSPKSPVDWFSLCEIIAPGFIREGNIHLFRSRLGVFEQRESIPGAGSYPHLLSWKDDENKCDQCGQLVSHGNHSESFVDKLKGQTTKVHSFVKSKNEVADLSRRLKGLVGVWLKKDCLDLPLKRYEIIQVKPTRALLNAAKIVTQGCTKVIEAMIRLRTLSDGFQYKEVKNGEETCSLCSGNGTILQWFVGNETVSRFEAEKKQRVLEDIDHEGAVVGYKTITIDPIQREITCPRCDGLKKIDTFEREIQEVECPKDNVLIDLLEEHEDIGRLNIYAGFTGSIERIVKICQRKGWNVIRVDGRGWAGFDIKNNKLSLDSDELYKLYQSGEDIYAFIGQPGAAGMGITLTASPTTVFFSNDFNGESRIQAEDRGHRIGMDIVRGGRIVDICHLPSDLHVLDNLKKKRDLQHLSMVGLEACLNEETSNAA